MDENDGLKGFWWNHMHPRIPIESPALKFLCTRTTFHRQ